MFKVVITSSYIA